MHYIAVTKRQGAVAIYRLDEPRGNRFFDASGNVLHAVINGAPSPSQPYLCTDWPSKSTLFGASGAFGDALADSLRGIGAYSISAIIKLTSLSGPQTIVRVGDENIGFMLTNGTGKLQVEYYDGSFHQVVDTGTALSNTTRYHVGVTRASDGKTHKFYLNGALNSTVVAGTAPTAIGTGGRLRIGSDTGGAQRLSGYLERISLFPGITLTAAQFADQYAAAFRVWPALQDVFDDKGYSETPLDNTSHIPMITGPAATAPNSNVAIIVVDGSMIMTAAQLDTLQAFYNSTIEGGQDTFEGNLRNLGTERYYWLSSPPKGSMDAEGGVYEAAFSVLALP